MTDLVWTLPAQPNQTARWEEPSGGGGGSLTYDQWLEYSGSAVNIANNANDYLTWDSYGAGDASLMNFSDPTHPTVVADGIYAVTAIVLGALVTDAGYFEMFLHLDETNNDFIAQIQSRPRVSAAGVVTCGSVTAYVPAGGTISVQVVNKDGASAADFTLREVSLQRLS